MKPIASDPIAQPFLPSRAHYYYARAKLLTDPVYAAARLALNTTTLPVLDVGCGIGVLAHYLAATGIVADYLGVDHDAPKIDIARAAAARKPLQRARFEVCDLARGLPAHAGNVVILDVLHYLAPYVQYDLLRSAKAQLVPGARLIIRSGLDDGSWRSRLTHVTDFLGHSIRWMKSAPIRYPQRRQLEDTLAGLGLQAHFQPLWGRTPFNNWLITAQ